jgi:hypothetical protein
MAIQPYQIGQARAGLLRRQRVEDLRFEDAAAQTMDQDQRIQDFKEFEPSV